MVSHESIQSNNPSRRFFTQQRRQLTRQERQFYARRASRHLCKLRPLLPRQAKVGLYFDDFGELPTQPILDWCKRLGYLAYLPVVGRQGIAKRDSSNGPNNSSKSYKTMRFALVEQNQLSALPTVRHILGMKQLYSRHLLDVKALDIIFCPLVIADVQGNRVGMGGGFYDTTLASVRGRHPLIVGWCYDFQVVAHLQRKPWDVPLDMLVTPSRLFRF